MDENRDNNNIISDFNNDQEQLEFKYNFITMPWDDRTSRSRVSIIVLLVSIFMVTMALVTNNLYTHYKNFETVKNYENNDISCYRLRTDEVPYVARLHSATTFELLCLGAVVSPTLVLANGVCVESGQIRMYIGRNSNPRCRKGFSVDIADHVQHLGVTSNSLVLLSSYENIKECSTPIILGHALNWDIPVVIIGRPFRNGRALSKQNINLIDKNVHISGAPNMHIVENYTLVGRALPRCPVLTGDLLMQNEKLFGIGAFQRNNLAFFGDLNPVKHELKEIDANIAIENNIYKVSKA